MALLAMPFSNDSTYPGHSGVDFPQVRRAAVLASGPGRVIARGWINDRAGYGTIIDYDNGPSVLYCHFPDLSGVPAYGSRVDYGSKIGTVNSTGNSTGDHLHMEIMVGEGAHTYAGIWNHFTKTKVVGGGSGWNITDRSTKEIQSKVGAKVDGIYGPETNRKIREWQGANGLVVDGIWGPKSDAKAFGAPSLPPSSGIKPSEMLKWNWLGIQKMLKGTGRYSGRIDNIKGGGTISGLQDFLNDFGYARIKEDGVFGPATCKGVQQWLKRKWGYTGAIDGEPGPKTKAAFERAEKANYIAFRSVN